MFGAVSQDIDSYMHDLKSNDINDEKIFAIEILCFKARILE